MTKNTKQLIITGALIPVLIVVALSNMPKKKKSTNKTPAPDVTATAAPGISGVGQPVNSEELDAFVPGLATLGPINEAALEEQRLVLVKEWGRDPFYSETVGVTSKKGTLELKGISWRQDGQSIAMINEEILFEGDAVEESIVKRIDQDRVVLEREGREYHLILEKMEGDLF